MIGTSQLINAFGAPVCFTDTTDIFKDGSGVALYGLDYDASDAGGTSGKFGEAAIFNGTSSKIELPSALSDGVTTDATCISFWFNVGEEVTSSTTGNEIMQFAGTSSLTGKIALGSTSGHMSGETFSVTHNVSGVYTYSQTNIPAGWNHAVVQWNSSDGKWDIYINSVKHTTYTVGTNAQGKFKLKFGNRSSVYYTGSLDQIRIYNTALTQSQVTQLFQENSSTVGTHLFGCIANYNLDGSAKESMGTTAYDGTETDITYRYDGTPTDVDFGVGGKSNYGARFDGSNSSLDIESLDLIQNKIESFSFWFKNKFVFGFYDPSSASSSDRRRWFIDNNTTGSIKIQVNNDQYNYEQTGITENSDWHHLTVVSDGKVYLDGIQLTNTFNTSYWITSGTNGSSRDTIRIGSSDFIGTASGGFYAGSIDQVRIFSKALSSGEVSKLYGNGAGEIACTYTSTTDNIALPITNTAYYKLDNNSKDSARSTGKFNEGAIFNGSSSNIQIPTTATTPFDASSEDFAISLWVNINNFGNDSAIINKWGSSTSLRSYWLGLGPSGSNNKIYIYEQGSSFTTFASTTTLNASQWYHIVYVRNATQLLLYIDDVLQTFSATNAINQGGTETLAIGQQLGYSTAALDGSIDQVRIFNVALSSGDVSNLYAETTSDTNTLSFPSGKTAIATYQLDGNSTDLSGNYNGTDTDITYAYDGTDTNIEYRFGSFGQAAVFNGSNSGIFLTTSGNSVLDYDNDFSVSMWFKATSLNANSAYNNLWTAGGTRIIPMQVSTSAGVLFTPYDGSNNVVSTGSGSISLNQWYNVVATRSKTSGLKIYLNGVLKDTDSFTGNASSLSQRDTIGQYWDGTRNSFAGHIDQVRIYDAALTSSQVTELYNEKPEVDTSNFKAVLYEGDSNTSGNYISNVGFQPDLVWIKFRNTAVRHLITDSVNGASVYQGTGVTLHSNETFVSTNYGEFTSFDANGFTVRFSSGSQYFNTSGLDYVAWCWKGGGDAVLNEQGTIDSQVSANTAAGFSIVKYTGNGANATVGHGLSSAPELIITKGLTTAYNWNVSSSLIPNGYLQLNTTDGLTSVSTRYVASGATTNSLTNYVQFNQNNIEHIAYCFHSVAGYSKIGTYQGNSSTTGPLVSVGFEPSFIMVKGITSSYASHWMMIDSTRDTDTVKDKRVLANLSNAESDDANWAVEFNSDGFQPKSTFSGFNHSSGTYLYMAFK